ncbi:MAG: O-antigen ligase family protein [Luteibaculaceae bacterium]
MEKQLFLLLFPFVFYLSKFDDHFREKLERVILPSLVAGALVFSFVALVNHIYLYRIELQPYSFFYDWRLIYHNYSRFFDLHATYVSLPIALAAVYSLISFTKERVVWAKVCWLLITLFLAYTLVVLSARIVYAGFILSSMMVLGVIYRNELKKLSLVLGAFTLLFSALLYASPYLQQRIFTDILWDLGLHKDEKRISEIDWYGDNRSKRWKSAVEVIKSSPLIGYGAGDEKHVLVGQYEKDGLSNAVKSRFDAHSQYLSVFIKYGIFGFILLVYITITGFIVAWRQKDLVKASFWILLSTAFFTENILDVNKGIFFFGFFATVFLSPTKINFYKLSKLSKL